MKTPLFGWLVVLLVSVLNGFLVGAVRNAGHGSLAIVLMFGVPGLAALALALTGVRLLGRAR